MIAKLSFQINPEGALCE